MHSLAAVDELVGDGAVVMAPESVRIIADVARTMSDIY